MFICREEEDAVEWSLSSLTPLEGCSSLEGAVHRMRAVSSQTDSPHS
jgi:hypothetical protein